MKLDAPKQISDIKQYCLNKGYMISGVYIDTDCSYKLNSRKKLIEMLNDIAEGKVGRVIIADKFRLSKHESELLKYIINRNNCEIEVLVSNRD